MQPTLEDKELSYLNQLFANLYEDENYHSSFSKFLEDLKELVHFQKGDIYFYNNENEHITFDDFIFVEWEKDSLNDYLNKYADMDDALPIVSLKQPVMFRSSDFFIQDERMKTKYYNELLLPAGMKYSIEGNIYNDGNGRIAGIGLHRPDTLGDFTLKELEIIKLARPHLLNIARKHIDKKQEDELSSPSVSLLSNIEDMGICIVDSAFSVVDCNLYNNKFIKPDHIEEILRFVVTLCRNLSEKNSKQVSPDTQENKIQSRATIGNTSYYAEVMWKEISQNNGQYIATLYNSTEMIKRIIEEAVSRFALTYREKEILICVVRGMNNAEISKKLFISIPTVKKHLGNIYTKMEVDGKHQAISKILE